MLMNDYDNHNESSSTTLKMKRAAAAALTVCDEQPIGYEFSPPWPSSHAPFSFSLLIQQRSSEFQLAEPRMCGNTEAARDLLSRIAPRHVVVVEQAPFSALKSIKAQEQASKVSNVQVISSLRNHPYNNTKSRPAIPTTFTPTTEPPLISQKQQVLATRESEAAVNKMDESKNPVSKETHDIVAVAPVSKPKQPQHSRNSSSNAILAHLRSISPNFKNIFVRPRNCKPIDASSLLNKSKLHYKNISQASNQHHETAILPLLYKNSTNEVSSSGNTSSLSSTATTSTTSLFNMMNSIEPKEIKLNSSVDELLKKFSTENDVIGKTIKNLSTTTSSSPAPLSNRDRTASATSSVRISLQQTVISPELNKKQSETTSPVTPVSKEKWTCMVCCSKHPMKQDICSICGSEKPVIKESPQTQQNFLTGSYLDKKTPKLGSRSISPSSESFSSYLISELGIKHKLCDGDNQDLDSSLQMSPSSRSFLPKVNPYLKKWTCIQCNYSNDSLKIVCLNCRWIKTSPNKSTIFPSKPDNFETPVKKPKTTTDSLLVDTAASASVCSSCKSPIVEQTQATEEAKAPVEAPPALVTAPKPASIFNQPTVSKWSCDTCLVSNPDDIDKCACCSTPKPSSKTATTTTSTPTTKAAAPSEPSSLFKKVSTSQGPKWNCETCLVSNADINDKCACCMTPKPSSKPAAVAPAPSSSLFNKQPASSNKWSCDTCLVSNDADKETCACCQSPKPGAKKSAPTSLISLPKGDVFKPNESSGISFGTSAATKGPISFGTTSNILKDSTPSTLGLFKLPVITKTTTEAESVSKPMFGSLSTTPVTFSLGSATEAKKPEENKKKELTQAESSVSFLSHLNKLVTPTVDKPATTTTTTPFSSFGPLTTTDKEKKSVETPKEQPKPFIFGEAPSTLKFGESTTTTTPNFGEATKTLPKFGDTPSTLPKFGETTVPKFGEPSATSLKFGEPSATSLKFGETKSTFTFGSSTSLTNISSSTTPPNTTETLSTTTTSSQPSTTSFSLFSTAQPTTTTAATPIFSTTGFGTSTSASTGSFFKPDATPAQTKIFSGGLFDNKQPATTTPTTSLFGNTSSTPSTSLFSSSATTTTTEQKPAASFNFFSTPQATPTLAPAAIQPAAAQMNMFQFTPVNSTQQTTPLTDPGKPQMFVPNLSAPMINFTANSQPNGFVFTGNTEGQVTPPDQIANRRRIKPARRNR